VAGKVETPIAAVAASARIVLRNMLVSLSAEPLSQPGIVVCCHAAVVTILALAC
jgi:hypothetical protein